MLERTRQHQILVQEIDLSQIIRGFFNRLKLDRKSHIVIAYNECLGVYVKTLILYGTRYGATKGTSEEIAKVFRDENLDVKVTNAQEEKLKDISEYGFVVVGSGVACGRWVNEAEDFLKKFRKEFENKKLALFVSSVEPIAAREGNTEEVAKMRKSALEDRLSKYSLKPISIGSFGGYH